MSRIISFLGRHKKALIALAVLAAAGAFGWVRMSRAAQAAQKAAAQQVQTFTLENTTGAQLLPLPASPGAAGQPTVLTITVLDRYGSGRFERLYAGLSAQ